MEFILSKDTDDYIQIKMEIKQKCERISIDKIQMIQKAESFNFFLYIQFSHKDSLIVPRQGIV